MLGSAIGAEARPPSLPPPKREVRAVWITTAAGLDWPRSLESREQQAALQSIVRNLRQAHFNTIFFQVRARGDAYYSSRYEPWAENLTGILGKDPGWDPLQFLLQEAHAAGLQVHAWFNVFKVRGITPVRPTTPAHPALAFPQWITEHQGEGWIDPGIPAARSYLLNVALDLVTSYDIDGLILDYVRYPGRDFPDGEAFARYGRGMNREEWRRTNINLFVKELYEKATSLKPMIRIGSSPLGVYDGEPGGLATGSYQDNYQDAVAWLRAGTNDYVAPQVYWNFGSSSGDPDFARLVRKWNAQSSGRHVYAGIAAYKDDVRREIPEQIDSARASGSHGEAFYRYEQMQSSDLLGGRYRTLANIPPMPWKDKLPPNPPTGLTATEISTNIFLLEWNPPTRAKDGDTARYYDICRSISPTVPVEDPFTLIAITPTSRTSWIDTIRVPSGLTYSYAVTALDKGHNESPPCTASTGIVRELLALKQKIAEVTSLSTLVSTADGSPTLVAYSLAQKMPVTLEVLRHPPGMPDSLMATVVRSVQEGGTYVVGLTGITFSPGEFILRLRTRTGTLEQSVRIHR